MRASFYSCDIIQRIRSVLEMKLMLLLLCDLLKLLLEKIIYHPESFLRHSEDDQQSKDDSEHQLEVMNFEAAAISDPTWFYMQVPVVPVVIDTEFIKKQLPVVLYRDLILKKTSRRHQFQATSSALSSSSSEQEMHMSSCIVCMNSMEGRDEVRELCNCEHVFHRDCLDAWIGQAQLTCPLCRSELLIPAPTSATTSKHHIEGGRDLWRAERMIYLFGEDIFFNI